MRNRLWYELTQAKYFERYSCFLISYNKRVLNIFNIGIALFSTGGVMGWKIWEELPVIACGIIAVASIVKLLQPYLIPSEKQIEKLDKITDFYFDFYLQLEKIWFDFENQIITETKMQEKFHELKQKEREINKVINEVHKRPIRKLAAKAKVEADDFFQRAFNT